MEPIRMVEIPRCNATSYKLTPEEVKEIELINKARGLDGLVKERNKYVNQHDRTISQSRIAGLKKK